MDSTIQDLRFALRLLFRNPLFTLTAALSLAVGIGANTTIFSLANALLFQPPAGVAGVDRLVDIGRSQEGEGFDNNSYPNFLDVRARSRAFTDVYAYRMDPQPMSLGNPGGAERIFGGLVSNNYFDALGVQPGLGRLFSRNDPAAAGASPFVVLSHRFWARRFHSDPSIVGRKLDLNGRPFTVAGVASEGFQGTTLMTPDLWVPMTMVAEASPRMNAEMLTNRQAVWLLMGGRLKPGVTLQQAQAELTNLGAALEREYPDANRGRGLHAVALSPIPGNGAPIGVFMAGLMGVVGLVLAVACANVAGILLARATARRREIAVRLALGAGRARLVRQMLVETVVLFAGGALLGLLLAQVMTRLIISLLPTLPVPVHLAPSIDARAIAFTVGLSLVAAILSGLAPAFHASKRDVVGALKSDQGGRERMRLRSAFVVAQVALSIVLVVGGALFVRALQRAATIDPGFDPRGVELASLDLALGGYTDATGPLFARQLLERVRATPGVESASLAAQIPLGLGGMGLGRLMLPGGDPERDAIRTDWNVVEPGYFRTMRTPLLRGRDFTAADDARAPWVAIVNQRMAHQLWPSQDPIGKTLVQVRGPADKQTLTVVGVARDGKYRYLGEEPAPFIYVPLQQQYQSQTTIVARSTQGQRLAGELRALLASMNPSLPIVTAQTLEDYAAFGLLPQRIAASVSGSLGIVGLLLAAMGIYGVTAFLVTSRTREIGIRMALGAQQADVIRLVLRQGMRLVAIGVVVGVALAAGASRMIQSMLFGIGPADPVAFVAASLAFLLVGLCACLLPARKAMSIDANEALRAE
ncbi:MAG TPA: ABC transporter permease [Thermoanaerobaculia bacterium]|nr:ABC transporter permease [Thermoanaerobaculia bacterium]